ncbi:MAG: branched-chain amino acid ABC transporter permease, partial [Nitrospinota bacterium]|nr:branched-chain amino acid ABC transporter permease [Nitrospinota bacterium]
MEVPSRLISPSLIWAGVGILGLVIWPFLIGQYWLQITIVSGVFVILAVSLNLIMGIAGQLSIAHAAFYGIGAYTSALLTLRLGLSFWVSLPLAMVFTAFLGYLIAIPALRLRGHYLAIVTLGFGVLIYQVLERWESMTRGVMALT